MTDVLFGQNLGFQAWSPRLLDAVWFGCIPVIIADWYALPLQGLIEWTDIAVFVPEAQVQSVSVCPSIQCKMSLCCLLLSLFV